MGQSECLTWSSHWARVVRIAVAVSLFAVKMCINIFYGIINGAVILRPKFKKTVRR
jgi:hypothetical protein